MAEVEIPFGNEAERALKNFNKRAMGALAPHFQKGLATATEPFFRCNLGQRYFTSGSLATGVALWLAATALSSLGGLLGAKIAVAVGLVVTGAFAWLGARERNTALQRQFAGAPRHSLSRGQPRLKDSGEEIIARLLGGAALLILAPPVGVLFVISQLFCAFLVAKQQEALMSRYLDALDQKIEGECLQDALLGKCPPEVTYLYKPLPETLNPELRQNIAAAACGKPVKIVAQAPGSSSGEITQEGA